MMRYGKSNVRRKGGQCREVGKAIVNRFEATRVNSFGLDESRVKV